ncbi:MAG: hypothetical protein WCT99_06720 [Bacteroidota bacterium]
MENLLMIAQIVVLLSLSALAVYFIIVLARVKDVLSSMEVNLKLFGQKVMPLLDNMDAITTKLRAVLENVDEQIMILRTSVDTLKSVADNVASFERRVQNAIESPIMDVVDTVGGVIRGFSSFITRITGGHSSE